MKTKATPYTDAVLQSVVDGANVYVPAIWRLEIVNALVVAERRKKIAPTKITQFLDDLGQFAINIDIDGLEHVFTAVLEHARRYQRSSYDASYLELALRCGLPLATMDEPLRRVAGEIGVLTFQP